MGETWTRRYDHITEAYCPGDTMPPVKDEWRYRMRNYHWKVYITGLGEKCKKYAPMRSDVKPVIKGNTIGIAVNSNTDEPSWAFIAFSELSIEKYMVKTRYRLISDDDEGVLIEFKDDDPVRVIEDGDW